VIVDEFPAGRSAVLDGPPPMPTPRASPGTYPVPDGRGRWRLTVHSRVFANAPCNGWQRTILAELLSARSRQLVQAWNAPAQLTFTLDGRAAPAALVRELQTDVYAWRWDDTAGADVCVFRGVVTNAEDQISENEHAVTVTCHDYLAMLERRYELGATPRVITATDQDSIASQLVQLGAGGAWGPWNGFDPGARMPMITRTVNPDGTARGLSGVLRDRTYVGGTTYATELDELAKVTGGFDYDVVPEAAASPASNGADVVRFFYPYQGVARSDVVLEYGASVSTVARTVSSADYANDVRVIGNKASSDPAAAQLVGEASNADAGAGVVGAWGLSENASDVTLQATVNQRAAGDLAIFGVLVPAYVLGLRPSTYTYGTPRMGDTVPLVIQSGRLDVADYVRVVGITYDVGDDGDENVSLVVGRPLPRFLGLLAKTNRTVNALARR
jgi:hypothetical protein